jgi:hypothetical protein
VEGEVIVINIADFDVFDFDVERGEAGEGEEAEAGEGFDFLGAAGDGREGEAEFEEFGFAEPEAGHGDETDFHEVQDSSGEGCRFF